MWLRKHGGRLLGEVPSWRGTRQATDKQARGAFCRGYVGVIRLGIMSQEQIRLGSSCG